MNSCKLKKKLYGLKKTPIAWYAYIDNYLMKLGFTRSNVVPNLYIMEVQGIPFISVLYFEYFFLKGNEPLMIECKRKLASKFEIEDLGFMHYFLGHDMWKRPCKSLLSQRKYAVKLLEMFGMKE